MSYMQSTNDPPGPWEQEHHGGGNPARPVFRSERPPECRPLDKIVEIHV